MDFLECQDRIMQRCNLSSTEARNRVKDDINEAYRRLVTSIGLGRVRRSTQLFNTTNGSATYDLQPTTVVSCVIKPFTFTYTAGRKVLTERTEADLRAEDPNLSRVGSPESYVVQKFHATYVTIRIYPTPNATYVVTCDGLVQGTDLSGNTDVPAFPEDFHDILVHRGLEEEYRKMEKPDLSRDEERKAEMRTRELRYFLCKSAYLHTQQASAPWWWGPYVSKRWGWY